MHITNLRSQLPSTAQGMSIPTGNSHGRSCKHTSSISFTTDHTNQPEGRASELVAAISRYGPRPVREVANSACAGSRAHSCARATGEDVRQPMLTSAGRAPRTRKTDRNQELWRRGQVQEGRPGLRATVTGHRPASRNRCTIVVRVLVRERESSSISREVRAQWV